MNRLGIIGAMEEEIQILRAKMQIDKTETHASMIFYVGNLHNKEIVLVRSGIGKVNAALCTQILINCYQVDGVINTGIAGSLKNEINIGDIVISTETLQHDVDATGFGYPRGVIPRMNTSIFEGNDALIMAAKKASMEVDTTITVFLGRIISGDQFISDDQVKQDLKNTFSGFCTEMEGAAIGQACYLNGIPFVVIRAISDKADNSAEMNYQEFEAKAVRHSSRMLEAMLQQLSGDTE